MIFFRIHEPQIYEEYLGTYRSRKAGLTIFKRDLGVESITEFLEQSEDYIEVPVNFAQFGDAITDKHSVAICLGDKSFTTTNGIYGASNTTGLFERGRCFRKREDKL